MLSQQHRCRVDMAKPVEVLPRECLSDTVLLTPVPGPGNRHHALGLPRWAPDCIQVEDRQHP